MNEQGAASVNAILEALPFGMADELMLFSIFGSQVRGTERPDSDLDVLFVVQPSVRASVRTIHDTIVGAPGGVSRATVIPHGPDTITRTANVYGTVEYHVLREEGARTLYRSADFDVQLHTEIDYEYCTKRRLQMAAKNIFPEKDNSALLSGSTCFLMCMAIEHLLRANLMSIKTKFSFIRDVRVLYDMLPPERRPPVDIKAVAAIQERYKETTDEECWSLADVAEAKDMAQRVYDFTCGVIQPKNLLVQDS